ncbi:hypothetical protein [Flavobacterium johnsoniae]|uniref:hypothetical protein n=1 Tax=Flavobacterium johnsoniae TaxID=986 RepID=UPI0011ED15BD|nr:hypothetical protein [Flavobacterium johnsoniae]
MQTKLYTEILKTLNDYHTSILTVQELVKIINPTLSFSIALSDRDSYEKIQEMVIIENLVSLQDKGLVLLNEVQEVRLAAVSGSKISIASLDL